ncbi:MAG: hypothetical protein V2A71_07795, partial [Candidatus Eisenbacteria bacterium]
RGQNVPASFEGRTYLPEVTLGLLGLAGPSKFLRGEREKGVLLTVFQGVATLGVLVEEWRAREFRRDYDEFSERYEAAQSEEEAAYLHARMLRSYELAENARGERDVCLAAVAAPALYGLLENLVLDRSARPSAVRVDAMNFELSALSPASAMMRGMLFPGMGQMYAGRTTAGTAWGLCVTAAGASLLVAHGYYRSCRVDYNEALRDYVGSDSEEAASAARKRVEEEFDRMKDARLLRRVLGGVTAGLWVASALDALRIPPASPGEAGRGSTQSLKVGFSASPGSAQVAVSVPIW